VTAQADLFGGGPALPEGFRYQAQLISPEEERALLEAFEDLDFKEFEFQGFLGKRRVVSYGWRYDFNTREVQQAEELPAFLLTLRDKAAGFAAIPPVDFQHALVTEYSAGAAIGWHKDKAVFGEVVGVSLLSACTFRLRRKAGATWERASIQAAPRSAYLLSGPARSEWEHSIPAVQNLRYSVTFRNFRGAGP
jgi:alkylated DNA repair dioxygenase AlkB